MKYDPKAWDRNPQGFIGKPKKSALERQLIKLVKPLIAGKSVLDVGCIDGRYYGWLGAPERYLGVDVTPSFIEEAERMWPRVSFKKGDVRTLDLGDESFDVVLCLNVLMHLPDLTPLVNLCRMAKEHVVISTYGSLEETYATHGNGFLNFWYSVEDIVGAIPKGWRIKTSAKLTPEWDKSKVLYQFVLEKIKPHETS